MPPSRRRQQHVAAGDTQDEKHESVSAASSFERLQVDVSKNDSTENVQNSASSSAIQETKDTIVLDSSVAQQAGRPASSATVPSAPSHVTPSDKPSEADIKKYGKRKPGRLPKADWSTKTAKPTTCRSGALFSGPVSALGCGRSFIPSLQVGNPCSSFVCRLLITRRCSDRYRAPSHQVDNQTAHTRA